MSESRKGRSTQMLSCPAPKCRAVIGSNVLREDRGICRFCGHEVPTKSPMRAEEML